ncbi:MAG: hypothetical protein LBD63_01155 [Mycoplasmataceae bacterium]|nr:hypothetical protein [Mycoplasmataceae bacterium]
MKRKIREWFNKQVQHALWIHQSKQSRVKFRWLYLGVLSIIFLFFIIAVVLFYFYGLRFNAEDPIPYKNGTNIIFLVLGIFLFVIAMILGIIIGGVYFPILYKQSRDKYKETKEYKQQVIKYNAIDLVKFTKRELKWLKKLGWINKIVYQQIVAKKQKTK